MAIEKTPVASNLLVSMAATYGIVPRASDGSDDWQAAVWNYTQNTLTVGRSRSGTETQIKDGIHDQPVEVRNTDIADEVTISDLVVNPAVQRLVTGMVKRAKPNITPDISAQIDIVVPDSLTYTIDPLKYPIYGDVTRIQVADIFNNVLVQKTAPATLADMEYSVDKDTGEFTFATAQKGIGLYINFFYEAEEVEESYTPTTIAAPTFKLILRYDMKQAGSDKMYTCVDEYDSVTFGTNITEATLQKDPSAGWSFSVKTLAPRPGRESLVRKQTPKIM